MSMLDLAAPACDPAAVDLLMAKHEPHENPWMAWRVESETFVAPCVRSANHWSADGALRHVLMGHVRLRGA